MVTGVQLFPSPITSNIRSLALPSQTPMSSCVQMMPEALSPGREMKANDTEISPPWPGQAPVNQNQPHRLRTRKQLTLAMKCGPFFQPLFIPWLEVTPLFVICGILLYKQTLIFRCLLGTYQDAAPVVFSQVLA